MTSYMRPSDLNLTVDGAQHLPAAALDMLADIRAAIKELPRRHAGVRIHGINALQRILADDGAIGQIASGFFDRECLPVRAILFDKTAKSNWSLSWHQDRTICVKRRIDVDGYGPWTTKRGMQHVAPPYDLLVRMLTLRVHLDDVSADNSPLLIAPGSHAVGRVAVDGYAEVVERFGVFACLARAGDVWIYSTPILHASEASSAVGHRRVLQVDYSADELDGGLEWLGI